MTASDILIESFERIKHIVHAVVYDMGQEKLAERPGENANSIAWLIWHLTRVQDDHVADLIGKEQVWTGGGWVEKFDLPFDASATGYGQSSSEVAMVQASSSHLTGYYDAVHDVTIGYLKTLTSKDMNSIIDTDWDPPVTRGARLVSILEDDLQHVGQAAYVRGLIE